MCILRKPPKYTLLDQISPDKSAKKLVRRNIRSSKILPYKVNSTLFEIQNASIFHFSCSTHKLDTNWTQPAGRKWHHKVEHVG